MEKGWIVQAEFPKQLLVIVPWIPAVSACHIEEKHQDLAAPDVPEKLMPQTDVLVGAFDQPRNITDGQPPVIRVLENPDLRMQRRERVWGDFRPGFRNRGEKRGLARVRIADQADFRDDAQFEEVISFLSRFPRLSEARGLPARGGRLHRPRC